MEKKKVKVEDVLEKILPIDDFRELDGHDDRVFKATLSFIMSCRKAKAKKITTKVMLAWDDQDVKERALLTEHYSKLQLVQIGMAVALTEPLEKSIIRKIFERAEEREEEDDD